MNHKNFKKPLKLPNNIFPPISWIFVSKEKIKEIKEQTAKEDRFWY